MVVGGGEGGVLRGCFEGFFEGVWVVGFRREREIRGGEVGFGGGREGWRRRRQAQHGGLGSDHTTRLLLFTHLRNRHVLQDQVEPPRPLRQDAPNVAADTFALGQQLRSVVLRHHTLERLLDDRGQDSLGIVGP